MEKDMNEKIQKLRQKNKEETEKMKKSLEMLLEMYGNKQSVQEKPANIK